MKQKRLTILGMLLVLLLAFTVVACGPAVPAGMEDEYEAIVNGDDSHGEEDASHEEADSHADDADTEAAHGEGGDIDAEVVTDNPVLPPPLSDRMPQDLADDEYTVSDTGLQYYDIAEGTGDSPEDGDIVELNYAIWIMDEATGEPVIIDDTFAFENPFTFIVGSQQVFPGWEEGVVGMQPGGSRQLMIPADLAFGETGIPEAGIAPNATIAMEIELLNVEGPPVAEELSDDDYETTDSGLQIAVLTEGSGEEQAAMGDNVTVEFIIWVAENGRFFTGSETSGQPFPFAIGSGTVFPGWDEGMIGMVVGEKRQLMIPAAIALGDQGFGDIVPPNSDLLMEIELLDIVKAPEPRFPAEVDEGDYEVTDSGLKYYDLVEGEGDSPETGQMVTVNYSGWLEDGTMFDSSVGRQPFPFAIGTGSVIPGWDEGVASMKVGGIRQLVIPSDLAYGDGGSGSIPPGATLIFEVEMLGFE